jgi:CubicO group peptidase (beta-lactamase class C family)
MNITAGLLVGISVLCASSYSAPELDVATELQKWKTGGGGGIAVAWVDAEGATFYQAGQYAADDPRPITADTQFEIGSISKVFTGLLLAECELQGKVRRSDSAASYLLPKHDPELGDLSKITLVSLATHSSGLPRLPNNMRTAQDKDPYASYDRKQLVEALRADGAVASTGAATAYSNFGAGVLGEAIAAARGMNYESALHQYVFSPLHLDATQVGITGCKPAEQLAPGHANGKRVGNWNFMALAPAGAVRSTARDMAQFLSAYLNFSDTPLKTAMAESIKPLRATTEVQGRIALHWFIAGEAPKEVIWHNGMTGGYASFIGFRPSTRQGVVILCNQAASPDALGFRLLGSSAPKPPVTAVTNSEDYLGRYPLAQGFALDVTQVKGALQVQATGQSRLGMREISRDKFGIIGVPAELIFERDDAGKVIAVVLNQNGKTPRGVRQALPAPVVRNEISLPVETLKDYVGSYPLQRGVEFAVTQEDGVLSVQLGAQPKFPVFATAKDEFFYKVVEAQLSFKRDAAGKVTGLVLHQNGQDLPAKKD